MAEEFEFDEYESLPQNASTATHMIAGSMAGVLEHCVMYPVDSVKVNISYICQEVHISLVGTYPVLFVCLMACMYTL